MRIRLLVLALLAAGCTTTPGADDRAAPPVSSAPAPAIEPTSTPAGEPTSATHPLTDLDRSGPPRLAYVRRHVLHRTDGSRLRIRLGLRGRWGITSLVCVGDTYLGTDDRWFEGTVGMYRVDARGRAVESWASTGPAVPMEDGGAAWVSLVAPESGESGPTQLHTDSGTQELESMIYPAISGYEGDVVTFTALHREGRRWNRRGFATDLDRPPYLAPTPSGRTRSPDGRHWWQFRRRDLVIGGPQGEVVLAARPFLQGFGGPAWEDDSHLLVTLTHRRRQAIGRIDVAGRLTLASDWSPYATSGFAFVARRLT